MSESDISREHEILVGREGMITVAGGKLTTYRRMAGEVMDTAVKLLKLSRQLPRGLRASNTDEAPLPGGVDWPEDDDHEAVAKRVRAASMDRLDADVALHLANTYGMRALTIARRVATHPSLGERLVAGRPEILAQVDWACREELAASVSDVMIRRTQLFYRDVDQGLGCVDAVARHMAELLEWTEAERQASVDVYRIDVERSRRWRLEDPAAR